MDPLPEDETYYEIIRSALAVCANYRPKFGKGKKAGLSLDEFQALYRADPFYTWFGLDSPLVYSAHKAAGGITSVYRQIGIACERLFRQLLQDSLHLAPDQAIWSYTIPAPGGKQRRLSLDGRIELADLAEEDRERVRSWLHEAAESAGVEESTIRNLKGVVFEVRQGYKSKDSKRQNADVGNAANAYAASLLPAVVLMSSQIDGDIAERYARAQWVLLRGTPAGARTNSTYQFCREVLRYDLAAFFERNTARIRNDLTSVIEDLLDDR